MPASQPNHRRPVPPTTLGGSAPSMIHSVYSGTVIAVSHRACTYRRWFAPSSAPDRCSDVTDNFWAALRSHSRIASHWHCPAGETHIAALPSQSTAKIRSSPAGLEHLSLCIELLSHRTTEAQHYTSCNNQRFLLLVTIGGPVVSGRWVRREP